MSGNENVFEELKNDTLELNKMKDRIERLKEDLNVLNDNVISTSANKNEKFQMLSFLPEIVEEYKKQTKKEINYLDICPYSIDDYSNEYKAFLYHIYHKENILDKIFPEGNKFFS